MAPSPTATPVAGSVVPSTAPAPSHTSPGSIAGPGLQIPVTSDAGATLDLDNADLLSGALEWLVPGILLTVPGLLLILIVLAQGIGAAVWLPAIRRLRGSVGQPNRRARRTV